MLPCADFPSVNKFLQISLVVQSSASTDDEAVGPKLQRGKNGERGFLVVAANPNASSSSNSTASSSNLSSNSLATSLDEMYHRCQEDDDSAAEDILEYRQHSFPEAKRAPYYSRLRIGLDTRDTRPAQLASSTSAGHADDNNSSSTSSIVRPTNPHKMTSLTGLDAVVPFHLLPRDDEGNLPFTIQSKHNATVNGHRSNADMREYVRRTLSGKSAVVVDDRDHSGAFWNVLGEILMAAVTECAPGKGIVKVFAMATPAVTMVGGHSMSKLYDLSKLPVEDEEEAAAAADIAAAAGMRRGGQFLPQEPSLQYNPSNDEYNLAGVSGVDLLVPPEIDPEEPPEDETPDETIERKRESVVSLLYLWIKSHHQAAEVEGAVHVVFIVQRIPDSDNPSEAHLMVVTGIFDESRSLIVKEDEKRNKPAAGQFSVWSKQLKEGEHHSQRLIGGASSVATLVREVMKILSKGAQSAKRELHTSTMREMIRSHVVTRLLKGSVLGPDAQLAWLSCIRRGMQLQAGRFEDPYSNESDEVKSYAVPPTSYITHLRVMETLTTLNKYRLRRAPPTLTRGTGPTGSSSSGFSSSPSSKVDYQSRAMLAPRRINNVGDQRSVQLKRIVFMKRKLEDLELRMRAKVLQLERTQRVKVEREKTAYRLREYAKQRKDAMIAKKKEIKEQMAHIKEDRVRRNVIRRKRQFTPVGKRSTNWNSSPPAPVVGRKRPATPPPVPKRIVIRRPPPPPAKPKLDTSQEGERPWAEPKLGGGGATAAKPMAPAKPAAKKAPAHIPNPRGGRAGGPSAVQPAEVKKIETNEFMQRTMIEQEWTRSTKKLITEAFDDAEDDDTTDRLLAIQKGNAPPPRVTSSLVSPTSRTPNAASPPNVPPARKRSGGRDRPTSQASASSLARGTAARRDSQDSSVITTVHNKKPLSPPPKPTAKPSAKAPRKSSISPGSSRSHSRSPSPVDSHVAKAKGRDVVKAATPPASMRAATTSAPAAAKPQPRAESPLSSRHSSPLSSRRSSRSSSARSVTSGRVLEEEVESVLPVPPPRGHAQRTEGPMVPIPVESTYVTPQKPARGSIDEEEENYRGRAAVRAGEAQETVRAVNSSTTITRRVRQTSQTAQLSTPYDSGRRQDNDDGAGSGDEFVEEDVTDVRSVTSTTKVQAASMPPPVQSGVRSPTPLSTANRSRSRSVSTSSSRSRSRSTSRSPTPPQQLQQVLVTQPTSADMKLSAASSSTNGPSATETPRTGGGGRQRFKSSDFSAADYGAEEPTAVVAATTTTTHASEGQLPEGAGSRRRSSIGHLMGDDSGNESDEFDLIDL